jgi:capsular polysaccharide biosynthesis protein
LDIRRFVDVVGRRLLLIVAVTLLAAGGTWFVSLQLPPEYEAESQVLVGSLTETNLDQLSAFERLAQTYAALGGTDVVIARVIAKLGLQEAQEVVADRLTFHVPAGQPIVRIDARAGSAQSARDLAATAAAEVIALSTPPGAGAASLASIIQPASLPRVPSSPRVLLNTLIGGLVGLTAALALALLASSPGRAAKSEADLGPSSLDRPERAAPNLQRREVSNRPDGLARSASKPITAG